MEEKRGNWEKLILQMGLESEARWDFSLEFKNQERRDWPIRVSWPREIKNWTTTN